MHPRVDLEVDGTSRPPGGGTQAADERLGVGGDHDTRRQLRPHRRSRSESSRTGAATGRRRAARWPRARAPRPARRRLLDGGPATGTAVPVAVGLHHRADLRRRAHRPEGLDVGAHRAEGHVRPRPGHQRRSSQHAGQRADQVRRHQPVGGPSRAGAGVQPGAARRRLERRHRRASRAPIVPLSTSPVPCGARRASPCATTRTSPPGVATTVVGPLRSTTAPASVARDWAAASRSRSGRRPAAARTPRRAVSTVGASRFTSRTTSRLQGGETVAVDHRRLVGGGQHVEDGRLGGRRGTEPGADDERLEPGGGGQTAPAHPTEGSSRPTASVGRAGSSGTPGDPRRTMPAPARWRRPRPDGRRRSSLPIPRSRARWPTTCGRCRSGREPPRAHHRLRPPLRPPSPRRARCPRRRPCPPSSAPARAPDRASTRRTSPCAPRSARPRFSPVVPSMPLGMSTASTGAPDTSGAWCPAEARAVGGVDHEVGPSRIRGAALASISSTRTPRRRNRRAAAPIRPVVALAGQHDHPAAVGALQQVEGVVGDCGAGALDELSTESGAAADGGHLVGREDRDHSATAMASASRWVWVIVSRQDRIPRSSASARGACAARWTAPRSRPAPPRSPAIRTPPTRGPWPSAPPLWRRSAA